MTYDIEAIRRRYAHYGDNIKPHTAVADIRALLDHIDTLAAIEHLVDETAQEAHPGYTCEEYERQQQTTPCGRTTCAHIECQVGDGE